MKMVLCKGTDNSLTPSLVNITSASGKTTSIMMVRGSMSELMELNVKESFRNVISSKAQSKRKMELLSKESFNMGVNLSKEQRQPQMEQSPKLETISSLKTEKNINPK